MSAKNFRFHLSTLLVLIGAAGVLLFLNVRTRELDGQKFTDVPMQESVELRPRGRGWPFTYFVWYEQTERKIVLPAETIMTLRSEEELSWFAVLQNALAAVFLLSVTGATAEYFTRKDGLKTTKAQRHQEQL